MEPAHWLFLGLIAAGCGVVIACIVHNGRMREEAIMRRRRAVTPECGGRETYEP